MNKHPSAKLRCRIRCLTAVFIVGLVVSGATAIPLQRELDVISVRVLGVSDLASEQATSGVTAWLLKVRDALHDTNSKYPFVAYGFDWLAFGHFVIAIAFLGAWRHPVRNIWQFQFGMIACVLVLPYAFIFGAVRGIPVCWRLIDCSFGVFGFVPLWVCYRWTRKLAEASICEGNP